MAKLVASLWQGAVPLGEAVWLYAVGYGLLVNFIASMLLFIAITHEAGLIALLLIFALPIPYNILVVIAVWRSADRYDGPPDRARLARLGIVLWMLALTLA